MWILKLVQLEPGDIILEPGIEAVAKATDGSCQTNQEMVISLCICISTRDASENKGGSRTEHIKLTGAAVCPLTRLGNGYLIALTVPLRGIRPGWQGAAWDATLV